MPFNFRFFFRLMYRSVFTAGGTHARLTKKRVLFLLIFYAAFIPWQLVNWFFLQLDYVLFPGFRSVRVREPVFIIGVPRSGSTHLMRVLAQDEATFACAKLWEVLLAPSITQRTLVRALARVDARLGSPFRRWLDAWEERAFRGSDTYHKIRLRRPDEDELNLVPIFSAIHLAFLFPFLDEFERYIYFDSRLGEGEKARFMGFYRRAAQRTLYVYGADKRLLSKSPAHSGRVATLAELFPDARFIVAVRDPAEVLPSTMSLFSFQWSLFADPLEAYPFLDEMVEMTQHWYEHPFTCLKEGREQRYAVVRYDDLTRDVERTVTEAYAALGLEVSPAYARALAEEAAKAQRYESDHTYSLREIGMSRDELQDVYRDVMERFGYGNG